MRKATSYRMPRAASEQLLDGGAGPAPLAHFLAAAAGPGTATELRGEGAALSAFTTAVLSRPLPDDECRSSPMHARTLSRIVVAKAIAALALTAGAGGVAVAATSTTLPVDQPEATTTHTAVPATPTEPDALPADGTDTDAVAEPPIDPADANGGNGLIGLCRAWAAGAASNPHVAENPAFTRLTTAAGGGATGSDATDAVAGFCATVKPDRPASGRPTPTPNPVAEPSGDTRAAGKPTGSPAGTRPAKPDRPDTPATGKPDRTNGKSGSTDEKAGKPDTDDPSGHSDGMGSDAGKAAAGG
jgi:hypothetical protein